MKTFSRYLQSAIQLKPLLERLYLSKNPITPLTGQDITNCIISSTSLDELDKTIYFGQNWHHKGHIDFHFREKIEILQTNEPIEAYKE